MILLDPDARPIIAHRGASGRCPENTWTAFTAAVDDAADAIELDVRLSRDGVAVVMHDATLDRTTNAAGPVAMRAATDLADVDPGDGQGVPTLAAVLERFEQMPLLVELKVADAGPVVADLLARFGAAPRVMVGSFLHAALERFRSAPYRCTGSRRDAAVAWAASRVGVAWGGRCQAFSVPPTHRGRTVVDARFVRACRRSGRAVHVWTVDELAQARMLRSLGVAGIITNHPARMRALSIPVDGEP